MALSVSPLLDLDLMNLPIELSEIQSFALLELLRVV
jgi:hypothetical protein